MSGPTAHPDYAQEEFDLSCERAIVIGNGNVAMDVARMLALSDHELRQTDTADHAIELLDAKKIREIVVLGRRGPAQAAFTNPEIRELGEMEDADVIVDPADDPASAAAATSWSRKAARCAPATAASARSWSAAWCCARSATPASRSRASPSTRSAA
ncbi:MAG: ferredoxin/flavodoxin---NADP+ reductase [Solirubrobacterales bacterium]|jgi:ferredoxin--NADP+ reductase|nr:ferredoxin/flavodoxin---NADP+ reductase [Solirubrobacterales bacterium]